MTFLELNGIQIVCSDEELIRLELGLARRLIDNMELLSWIITHS